jgi:hypothetical protein
VVKKNAPEIMDFATQIATVDVAGKAGYDNISADVSKVRKDLIALKQEAEKQQKDKQDAEKQQKEFTESILAKFTGEAEERLIAFEEEVGKVNKKYEGLLKYFHEDVDKSAEEFFNNLAHFCRAFKKACGDVENEEKTKVRLKRQEEEKKRLADMKQNKQRRASLNPAALNKFAKMPPPGPPPGMEGKPVGDSASKDDRNTEAPGNSKRAAFRKQRRNTVMGAIPGSPSLGNPTSANGRKGIALDDDSDEIDVDMDGVPPAKPLHHKSRSLAFTGQATKRVSVTDLDIVLEGESFLPPQMPSSQSLPDVAGEASAVGNGNDKVKDAHPAQSIIKPPSPAELASRSGSDIREEKTVDGSKCPVLAT